MDTFLSGLDDVKWLFQTHLKHFKKWQPQTKSFIFEGNEDYPFHIRLMNKFSPTIYDSAIALFEPNEDGEYFLKSPGGNTKIKSSPQRYKLDSNDVSKALDLLNARWGVGNIIKVGVASFTVQKQYGQQTFKYSITGNSVRAHGHSVKIAKMPADKLTTAEMGAYKKNPRRMKKNPEIHVDINSHNQREAGAYMKNPTRKTKPNRKPGKFVYTVLHKMGRGGNWGSIAFFPDTEVGKAYAIDYAKRMKSRNSSHWFAVSRVAK